jgi:uncharacterized protein (DUF486 family)
LDTPLGPLYAPPTEEQTMLAIHGVTQQNTESIRTLIVVFVLFVVTFWRAALQIAIIIAGAVIIIGVVTLVHGVLHVFG